MPPVSEIVNVNFRAERDLLEQFKQVVAADERTVSAELRHYMRRRVDGSEPAPSPPSPRRS
jgi:hypothetical protein